MSWRFIGTWVIFVFLAGQIQRRGFVTFSLPQSDVLPSYEFFFSFLYFWNLRGNFVLFVNHFSSLIRWQTRKERQLFVGESLDFQCSKYRILSFDNLQGFYCLTWSKTQFIVTILYTCSKIWLMIKRITQVWKDQLYIHIAPLLSEIPVFFLFLNFSTMFVNTKNTSHKNLDTSNLRSDLLKENRESRSRDLFLES